MNIARLFRHRAFRQLGGLLLLLTLASMELWAKSAAPNVAVTHAEQIPLIEEVPLTGSVVAPHRAKLSTEVSGIVETIAVEVGDRVAEGDEILQLNADLAKHSLGAAKAATDQAIQELEDAKRRLKEARSLAERHNVSASEIESLSAEVRIDSAGLQRVQAEQQREASLLERHRLSAPFAGVVSSRSVERGEWVQPGDPVVELVADQRLRIDFQVPQAVFAKLSHAQNISVTLDALPNQLHTGVIDSVIPVTDPATRTFTIRVALQDQVRMTAGMSASAMLRLQSGALGVVVPRDALLRYPDGRTTVWVTERDGEQVKVAERQVRTGLSFDGKVALENGLAAGEEVVVRGNEALREGQGVVIVDGD